MLLNLAAVRLLQLLKALMPTFDTEAISMVCRLLQSSKALDSISSQELGRTIEVRLSQLLKALPPIFFTPSGMLMLFRLLHLLNA